MSIATASADPALQGTLSFINEYGNLINFVMLLAGLVGFGVYLGSFKTRFGHIEERVTKMLASVERLNLSVVEIQTALKTKLKNVSFSKEILGLYGKSESPMVLRDEYKPLVQESGLEAEVHKHKHKLVSWLKKKKPQTGLDAQDLLMDFVITDEVEKYIDTTSFKEYLYQKGETPQDYYVILAIYLFEEIIPEVIVE